MGAFDKLPPLSENPTLMEQMKYAKAVEKIMKKEAEKKKRRFRVNPWDDRTCLYRHYDIDDVLLYVGISHSAMTRQSSHDNNSDWFRHVVTIRVEHYNTREEAKRAETKAILTEKPKYNLSQATPDQRKIVRKEKEILRNPWETGDC